MEQVIVDHLHVRFGNKIVLEDLSFSFSTGVLAVLGQNGSGKTSLLSCIAGVLKPMSGRVTVQGHQVNFDSPRKSAKSVTYVQQENENALGYLVQDFVLMGRAAHLGAFSAPSKIDREICSSAMKLMGIEHLGPRPYTQVSGGERRLAMLARALCQQSPTIVLDEPTSFLDIINTTRFLKAIKSIASLRNNSIVVSVHDINQAIAYADLALLIFSPDRQIIGTVSEVLTVELASELYGAKFEEVLSKSGKRYLFPMT
jgi:iron complex transport system ATP-binding protein